MDGIGWFASPEKERVYFVQLDEEIKNGRSVRIQAPKRVSYEQSDRLELKSNYQLSDMEFYAYGSGHLLKVTTDFSEALSLAYDQMGFVTDKDRNVLWNRVKRGNIRNIRDPQSVFAPLARYLDDFTGNTVYESRWQRILGKDNIWSFAALTSITSPCMIRRREKPIRPVSTTAPSSSASAAMTLSVR